MMGTNYYAKIDGEWIHVGKASVGNRFLWHGCREGEGPETVAQWFALLRENPTIEIEDEYDGRISVIDFIAMVEMLQAHDIPPRQPNPRPGLIPEYEWQRMLPGTEGEFRISYNEFS